jgi:hypothetical protein
MVESGPDGVESRRVHPPDGSRFVTTQRACNGVIAAADDGAERFGLQASGTESFYREGAIPVLDSEHVFVS